MTVIEIERKIEELNRKVLLSDSQQERELLLTEISKLKEDIVKSKETEAPVVVPIKDAPTVGDKIERRLKGGITTRASFLGNSRFIL